MMKRFLSAGVLLLFLLPGVCSAQNFSLDTARMYENVTKGKTIEKFIKITYAGGEEGKDTVVDVLLSDWIYDDVEQQVRDMPANTQPNSCVPWINVSPNRFTISKETKEVEILVSITVPSDLEFPEYNALLFFSTSPGKTEISSAINIAVEMRMAVIVRLTNTELAVTSGEVMDFDVVKNEEDDAYDLSLKAKNTGNIILFVGGNFSIIDDEGNLYGRGELPRTPVSPGITQTVIHTWYGELDSGEYDVVSTVEVGSEENIEVMEKHISVE